MARSRNDSGVDGRQNYDDVGRLSRNVPASKPIVCDEGVERMKRVKMDAAKVDSRS